MFLSRQGTLTTQPSVGIQSLQEQSLTRLLTVADNAVPGLVAIELGDALFGWNRDFDCSLLDTCSTSCESFVKEGSQIGRDHCAECRREKCLWGTLAFIQAENESTCHRRGWVPDGKCSFVPDDAASTRRIAWPGSSLRFSLNRDSTEQRHNMILHFMEYYIQCPG